MLQTIGLFFALLFNLMALPEVWKSTRITHSEKIMWSVGFLTIIGLAGIVYLANGRKRI